MAFLNPVFSFLFFYSNKLLFAYKNICAGSKFCNVIQKCESKCYCIKLNYLNICIVGSCSKNIKFGNQGESGVRESYKVLLLGC